MEKEQHVNRLQTRTWRVLAVLCLAPLMLWAEPSVAPDPRHLTNGWNIPSEGYADQPYVVKTEDGAWLCVITTGPGAEGAPGQHVVSMRSTDQGRTWSDLVDIEPASGPESAYAVLLKAPGGRVYAFYNHNTDRVAEVKREDGGVYKRVDSLGHYVFKFSDDHGRSWSGARYEAPIREFECDRNNVYGGALRFFWNVGKPVILGDRAIMVIHKVGAMGPGFFAQSEGAFFASSNILTEADPEKLVFETLPDGDVGLRTPPGGGRVAEEQSIVPLSDGSLYCIYRTVDGWPACAYSRDGGHTWSEPAYATYAVDGKRIKHPRAANFVWRCANGKFLYWFHNHGGAAIRAMAEAPGAGGPYNDRNPAWLMAGEERDTPSGKVLVWTQPEILLYDDDPFIRMSYPDLLEEDGRFFVTETQKHVGRVHEIPQAIIDGLFEQFDNRTVAEAGRVLDVTGSLPMPGEVPMPLLPEFLARDGKRPDHGVKDLRAGFSLDLWLNAEGQTGEALLDTRDASGKGILVSAVAGGAVRLVMNDGRQEVVWESDPGGIALKGMHHVVITVDGGPKIITFVVNGVLCDGGESRQFGWGRFSPTFRGANGAPVMKLGAVVRGLRVYDRALRTSEAVGNFNAGFLR
ncbi:MAG: exo-alpha-sialidase [Candidatus Hydrogenedentes bacterium]|nr:exo-alpha-sialidase [Candidatus Hydrogenedentota bacterium]